MGKIPPSFRSALSNPNLIHRSSSLIPSSPKPHHFPNKTRKPHQKQQQSQSQSQSPKPVSVFKSPNLQEAKSIFNSFVNSSNAPIDSRFHNSLLQSYASISTINDSIAFLRHMTKTHPSFSPDKSTYHILLTHCCKSTDSKYSTLSLIHQTLNLMVSDGISPDKGTVDLAVRSLCTADRVDDAVELIKELSSKHCSPDIYSYNFLVKNLCKSRTLSLVYAFIDEMRTKFDVKPNLVTYTILIDNVCNTKNLREATRLVDILEEEGFKPDCFLYNTIMKGYCMLSRGSEAIEVYNRMKEKGVEPDLITYNTLIFGLSKSGRVSEAKKLLRVMAEKGHFPDEVTYTSLMNGMCRKGETLAALALLEEMEMKGCSPNTCTYNTLLHGLCKSRMFDKAMELYGAMKSDGLKLDMASYATFVRALCSVGRVADAYEVFDYAVESKSLSDVAAYSTLESTLKWFKKAKEEGLKF
ncbi:putative tetratricopeptide-like helical domain-containing protein [Medicago truncatula]|uniref:PPR containing plant-like protein n=1 Tax=Medicago truncatula TaxID=3880 RepID=G7LAS1_MEDTR|nr:pentatricopeptide repeat-containing protein At2g17670 [Medicago truncatula]AET01163.2 PPR containing plant-like protein [Medicago truncatula]RHN38569.1 putative tetratricopeptide-like helical domain-containing protein [Medicago truncatula]